MGRQRSVANGKTIYQVGSSASQCEITLLAEGYPINFYGSESLPNDTIDPIMTLLLICAVELTLRDHWPKTVNSDAIGDIVEKRRLIEKFLEYAY